MSADFYTTQNVTSNNTVQSTQYKDSSRSLYQSCSVQQQQIMSESAEGPKKKGVNIINKKKFKELEYTLTNFFQNKSNIESDEVSANVLALICDVLQFDPNERAHAPEVVKKQEEKKKEKAKELGVSVYSLVQQSFYLNNREKRIAAVKESRKKRLAKNEGI